MTDFQLGLIAIGALAVVAVLAFNKWQERAYRREAQTAFESRHADVLLDTPAGQMPRVEPGMGVPQRADRHPDAGPAGTALPDPRIDYILELRAVRPIAGYTLTQAWAPVEHRFAQRALFAGNSGDGWQACAGEGQYTELRAALQLVNRRGPVGDGELLEFRAEVDTLASRLGATVDAPEMAQALERGRSLDQLCAETDIQVVVHVVPGESGRLATATVRRIAESAGLVAGPDGRYALRESNDQERYCLYDRSGAPLAPGERAGHTVQALSLAMDVPRAPETPRSFESMARLARDLAAALGGRLVDDNDRALDEQSLAAIGRQLDAVRGQLDQRGIAPGSALALRLFS
jgi:FtsZ-interacting cell division protein ZipA